MLRRVDGGGGEDQHRNIERQQQQAEQHAPSAAPAVSATPTALSRLSTRAPRVRVATTAR